MRIDRIATSARAGWRADLAEFVPPGPVADQVSAAGFETAISDMDDAVPCRDRRPRWNEGLEPDQSGLRRRRGREPATTTPGIPP
jgi:hypothetical protein